MSNGNLSETLNLKDLVTDPSKLSRASTHYDAKEALDLIIKNGNTDPVLLKIVLTSPKYSYFYARQVSKGPFTLGEPTIAKDAKYSYLYAKHILDRPFPLGEPVIAKDINSSYLYATDVLQGRFPLAEKLLAKNPNYALSYAQSLGDRFVQGEPAIAKDSYLAYLYAEEVLKGPFPLGEKSIYNSSYKKSYEIHVLDGRPWTGLDQQVSEALNLKKLVTDPTKLKTHDTHISTEEAYRRLQYRGETDEYLLRAVAKNPMYSCKYAENILKGPFPLGEPAIAKDPKYSYYYARTILKKPWPPGEPAIAKSAEYSFYYANLVLKKKPFPLGEPIIAASAWFSFLYAEHVLKGPFPLGEPAIYHDGGSRRMYEQYVLKGKPWTGLDQKVDESMDLKKLVSDPKKLKTHKTHISPKEAYERLANGEKDEYLIHAFANNAEYSYLYARDILKKRFPLGEPAIAKSGVHSYLYADEVLKRPFPLGEPAIATNGYYSYWYAKDVLKKPFPLGEPAIAKEREVSILYKKHILKGQPWARLKKKKVDEAIDLKKLVSDPKKLKTHDTHISPQEAYKRIENGETDEYLIRAIAKDAEYSYLYAEDILKKRFPLGEPAIAKSAEYSFLYANYVLKKRFLLGEPAISKSAEYSYYYAEDVLKGPFTLGEPTIATDSHYSYVYASTVLKKPFPLGEPAIATDRYNSDMYQYYVLKGKPWTGLDRKLDEALDLKKLVSDPTKLKTVDTHISPDEALERLKKGDTDEYLVKVITKYPKFALIYAQHVLKGPFPLGEPAIAKDAGYSYIYARAVLEGPFPLGEPAIAKDGHYSYLYAKYVLNGPFSLGEPEIYKDPDWKRRYVYYVLQRTPWPSSDQPITEAIDLKKLVSDPTKLQTYDTHLSPKEALDRLLKGQKEPYLEAIVAKDTLTAYNYALAIQKPFPLGEETILKDPVYAAVYARNVLKEPWPLAEPIIATSASASWDYANKFGPFPLGEPVIAKWAEFSYEYSKYVLKAPFLLGEPVIYADPFYRTAYENLWGSEWKGIKGDLPVDDDDPDLFTEALDLKNLVSDPKKLKTHDTHIGPKEAFEKIKNGKRDKYLVKAVATSPKFSYLFAKEILKYNPFPLGEPAITTDVKYSYYYAKFVLEKPFPLGEPTIAKEPWYAYWYAIDVLKGRFKLGEPAIAKNAEHAFYYAKDVLKKPWSLGEPAISKSAEYSYYYAERVLKKPFPLGEPTIAKDAMYSYVYAENVLKGKPWTGLDQKVDEAIDLEKLVSNPKKLKNLKTHVRPTFTLIRNNILERGYPTDKELKHLQKIDGNLAWLYLYNNKTATYLDIKNHPGLAYYYARDILRGPFPEGEAAIATSAVYSYYYAKSILNDSFPLGEPAIAKDKEYSYRYVKDVLNGPFPLGEPAIAKVPVYSFDYAYNITKKPFPLGEPAIAKNLRDSILYARDILKGRFILAEPSIYQNNDLKDWYEKDVLGGKPLEPSNITEAIDLKKLVTEPKKLKKLKTHIKPTVEFIRQQILKRGYPTDKELKHLYTLDFYTFHFLKEHGKILSYKEIQESWNTAIMYAVRVLKGRFKEGEKVIAQHDYASYYYALYALKGPFKLGEPAIAKNSIVSYQYARDVLDGPFTLGEPAIAETAMNAYMYAHNILKGPFTLGEPVIAANPHTSVNYAGDVLNGPFTLGEPIIAESAQYSYLYASYVLKGPFPLGEKSIYESNYRSPYEIYVLKDQPWTGLDQKVDEAIDLKKLVSNPKKLKTHKTHISPKEAYYKLANGEKDEYLIRAVAKDAEYSYLYANEVLKGPFPLGEPAIAKSSGFSYWYARDVLKSPFPLGEPVIATDAWNSYKYAHYILKGPFPLGEPVIANDMDYSYVYARDVLKGPFPLGEPQIAKSKRVSANYLLNVLKGLSWTGLKKKKVDEALDLEKLVSDPKKLKKLKTHVKPTFKLIRSDILKRGYPTEKELDMLSNIDNRRYSWIKFGNKKVITYDDIKSQANLAYYYARDILKEPFPEGEPAIAKNADYSCWYAEDVLKGPFPLGEPAIAKNSEYSYWYANDTLKGPFPLGEPAIAKDAWNSYAYARTVLNKPFPLGEPAIAKNKNISYQYTLNVLKGRSWTDLKKKKKKTNEAIDLKNLVATPKKLKTYKTHISPREAYDKLKKGEKNGMLIQTILKDINYAYLYVINVLKGRFIEAEPLFATSSVYAVMYAIAINERFIMGEPIIAQTVSSSIDYATEVMHGRFPLGEPVIAQSAFGSLQYATEVLKGRFELGEPILAEYATFAYQYATTVLHDRFILGEKAILENPYITLKYAINVIKGPWKEAEDVLKDSAYYENYLKFLKSLNK